MNSVAACACYTGARGLKGLFILMISIGGGRCQYYFMLLAGRNRRMLADRERRLQRLTLAVALFVFLTFATALGLLVLCLVKSALGTDWLPE